MDQSNPSTWSAGAPYDPLAASSDHDFDSLLNYDHFDITNFGIDFTNETQHHNSNHQLDLVDSLTIPHLQDHLSHSHAQGHHDVSGQVPQQKQDAIGRTPISQPGNDFFPFSLSGFAQQGQQPFSAPQEQVFHSHGTVPPTPNSVEMHGDTARYLEDMETNRAVFGEHYHIRKEDPATTTPAATPQDPRPAFHDFAFINPHFSPLTSPALQAQNSHQHAHFQTSQYNTPATSADMSPIHVGSGMLGDAAMSQTEPARRLRTTRKPTQRGPDQVRQSPITKPSRRKTTLPTVTVPHDVGNLVEDAHMSIATQSPTTVFPIQYSFESSGTESISPKSLSEMGPPPKPGSAAPSPAIVAGNNTSNTSGGVCPATPASLMRLQTSPHFTAPHDSNPTLEDLALPEPARADMQLSENSRRNSRKVAKLAPVSSPSAIVAMQGRPSPLISAVNSPTSPMLLPGNSKKGDPKAPRNNKKRNSVTSTHPSPAIRPKISPIIKPNLPEGGVSDEMLAQTLAKNSNYTNIIEGRSVPGVAYPDYLSANITSKRTSHKMAEQGRRNRINTGIQQLQALLPSPIIKPTDAPASPEASATAGSLAQQNNSKAATVESAVEYIKALQKETAEKERMALELENVRRELAELKGRLASPDVRAQVVVGEEEEGGLVVVKMQGDAGSSVRKKGGGSDGFGEGGMDDL